MITTSDTLVTTLTPGSLIALLIPVLNGMAFAGLFGNKLLTPGASLAIMFVK